MIKGNFMTAIPDINATSPRISRHKSQLPLILNKKPNQRKQILIDNSYVSIIDISSIIKQEKLPSQEVVSQHTQKLQFDASGLKAKSKSIGDQFLLDFFKDKCYEDFEEKFRNQMKGEAKAEVEDKDNQRQKDKKILRQLSQMKKVVDFWTAFCKYVSPKISGQKFHYSRKNNELKDQSFESIKNKYIRSKSLSNLYSNSKSVRRVFHSKAFHDEY